MMYTSRLSNDWDDADEFITRFIMSLSFGLSVVRELVNCELSLNVDHFNVGIRHRQE